MNYYFDRILKILNKARELANEGKWEHLESYADSKLDEIVNLAQKGLSVNFEENRWEFYTVMIGSHTFESDISGKKFKISLNLEGDSPIVSLA